MTREQYERLPELAKEIIETDRALRGVLAPRVVAFDALSQPWVRELRERRKMLTVAASRAWGEHGEAA